MRRIKEGQKGFTVIEGVAIVLVVAALAFGSWWVWQKNKTKVTEATTNGSNSSLNHSEKDPVTPQENRSVFKIPELGIQLTVPDYAKDLVYEIGSGRLEDGRITTYAIFSTKSLMESKSRCSLADTSFGSLGKIDGQYPATDETRTVNAIAMEYGILVKQFPTYFISRGIPNGGGECQIYPDDPPGGSWRSAFADMASSVEEIKE